MTQKEALAILKTGANIFLTGEPGSGKTHTVNAYVKWLREHGIEPAITASTGIAATHIGGYTIHSWSGLGIKNRLTEEDLDFMTTNEKLSRRVNGTNILIIDEVSMLSNNMLTMVDLACRALRSSSAPFGGLQVVLVGDFFQLPPVIRRIEGAETGDLFENQDRESELDKRFAFHSPSWNQSSFVICYLSEQHRQEDEAFLDLLGAIRRREISDDHHDLLKKRFDAKASKADTPKLFSHNVDVDALNEREIDKISSPSREFVMGGRGPDRLVAQLKKGCLSPETLHLKVGARVMFTKNNFEEGYVNGTLGKVIEFSDLGGNPIVKTDKGKIISVEKAVWAIEEGNKLLASISQIPLRLAWAITIHKSQGMSLDAAHMDLSDAFEYGQGYVALSRVRTLSGLVLSGINARALEVHPDIAERDIEFRELSFAAQNSFDKLTSKDLTKLHDDFVRAAGGRKLEF